MQPLSWGFPRTSDEMKQFLCQQVSMHCFLLVCYNEMTLCDYLGYIMLFYVKEQLDPF